MSAAPPVVVIDKLWSAFRVRGVQTVIHQNLDLTVERGEILSIVGGSGGGKTVLLRQMLGLEIPLRGHVQVLGYPAGGLAAVGVASQVGMLFQHGALFSAFTVLENIALPLMELRSLPQSLIRDIAMVKLQMVGLSPAHAHKMPADLSGGMVKRVALARALVMDPPLLLLDEPTAGLDPDAAEDFCTLLQALHEELRLSVVMVTHDLDTIYALSSRIAVVADKRVVTCATPQEVVDFAHPFVRNFFKGGRGLRAMEVLRAGAPAA